MTKTRIVLYAVGLAALSYAAGHYTARLTQPEIVSDKEVTELVDSFLEKRKETRVEKSPDGREVTTIVENTTKASSQKKESETHVEVKPSIKEFNISALAGLEGKNSLSPVWGLSVTKQIIGPISAGLFGLSNGIVGVSVGLNF